MRHGPTNVAQDRTERWASPRPTGPHAVTHPLPPRLIIFSHPHRPTQTPHTQKISPGASIPSPLHIHTQGNGISCRDVIFVSLSLDHSHFSCYLSHAPAIGPSIHASLEYVIHTHTSLQALPNASTTHSHMLHHVPHWSKKPSLHVYFAYNIPFE